MTALINRKEIWSNCCAQRFLKELKVFFFTIYKLMVVQLVKIFNEFKRIVEELGCVLKTNCNIGSRWIMSSAIINPSICLTFYCQSSFSLVSDLYHDTWSSSSSESNDEFIELLPELPVHFSEKIGFPSLSPKIDKDSTRSKLERCPIEDISEKVRTCWTLVLL